MRICFISPFFSSGDLSCLVVNCFILSIQFNLSVCLRCRSTIGYNVLALGEEADFEALNCLPALNLKRSTKLHLSREPAFLPNACYLLYFSLRQFNYRPNFFFFDVKSYGFVLVNWAVISIDCSFVK